MADSEKAKNDSLSLINNEPVRAAAWQALLLNTVEAEWPLYHELNEFGSSTLFSVALHVAAYFGLFSVVQAFLGLGYDVDQLDGTGRTPVHWAIIGNQNTILKFLLEHGANANAEIENDNDTLRRWRSAVSGWKLPLPLAAYLDNRTAIECLLHHGAEINKISKSGRTYTALYAAIFIQSRSITQVLVENGADVNVDLEGLRFTAKWGNLERLKMVVDAGLSNYNIQRALASAAAGSNYSAMVFLVEHGANANGFGEPLESCKETDSLSPEERQTPLALCAGPGNEKSFKCYQYLIEAGASLDRVCARARWNGDVSNGPQTTALHRAAYRDHLDMARSLLVHGADVNLSLGEYVALSGALSSEDLY